MLRVALHDPGFEQGGGDLDVERALQLGNLTQVDHLHALVQATVGHVDREPPGTHRLDVGRLLLDEGDIEPSVREVGAD